MSKYYRVRTQEQWDWLKNKLEIKGDLHVSYFPVTILDGDIFCGIYKYHDDPEPLIEVSQMMEDEKMEDYVEVKDDDLLQVKNENDQFVFDSLSGSIYGNQIRIRKMYIPKSLLYPKVKFTEEEKREFDDIKKHVTALYNAMVLIFEHRDECINLNNKLFYSAPPKYLNDVQRDFARAWNDESLIEVIPDKKWNVKVPPFERTNKYYYKFGEKLRWAGRVGNDDEDQQFTADELKEYGLDDDMYEKVEVKE